MVKIFKLLINELSHLNESILLDEESDYSDDSEKNLESGNETQQNGGPSSQKVLKTSDLWLDEEEDEDDQLLKELENDPIFKKDMNENLTNFLKNFTNHEQFSEYVQYLTENEKNVLRGIQANNN